MPPNLGVLIVTINKFFKERKKKEKEKKRKEKRKEKKRKEKKRNKRKEKKGKERKGKERIYHNIKVFPIYKFSSYDSA